MHPIDVGNTNMDVTRYGRVRSPQTRFGNEERFLWQSDKNINDVSYQLPSVRNHRSVRFGQSLRQSMDEMTNPDSKTRDTGPGSYDISGSFDFVSDYVNHQATRFAGAPRKSMEMKTPSPGAVYNIEKKYYTGPDKREGISFSVAGRSALFTKPVTANADMYVPKPDRGPEITMGLRPKKKLLDNGTPGCIYDSHVCYLIINPLFFCLFF